MGSLGRAAWRGMVSLCLSVAMAACGGGGGGSSPPPTAGPQPDGSWQLQRLGTGTTSVLPGNTYRPVGGEPAYALWLDGTGNDCALKLSMPSAPQRGLTTQALMGGLPCSVNSNATVAVVAGGWSMVAWTESTGAFDQNLLIRLKGPTLDSGAVLVSSAFQGSASDVRLVIDAAGNARAYWDESSRLGVNGLFRAGIWEPGAELGESLSSLQRYLVSPDGQGWLFREVGGTHEVRRITAANGLGPSQNLVTAAGLSAVRLASEAGTNGFLTVTFQAPSSSFLVRRMANGTLQAGTSILADGVSGPNENHVGFDSDASGRAVLVWSSGTNDRSLQVARRSSAGVWSVPATLVNLPTDPDFSLLSGLKVIMGPQGQALVVYRAALAKNTAASVWAVTAQDGGNWSAPVELAKSGYENREVALAFNAQGTPGVLQLVSRSGDAAVLMSTWRNGGWVSETLRQGMLLAYFNTVLLSTVRLAPHGERGWVAAWDEGQGPGSSGSRELWAAEYR